MRPYGARRTYAKCTVVRCRHGKAKHVRLHVKNHKRDRSKAKQECQTVTTDIEQETNK